MFNHYIIFWGGGGLPIVTVCGGWGRVIIGEKTRYVVYTRKTPNELTAMDNSKYQSGISCC